MAEPAAVHNAAEALRHLVPGRECRRIWARASAPEPGHEQQLYVHDPHDPHDPGPAGNVWAADPEDIARLVLDAAEQHTAYNQLGTIAAYLNQHALWEDDDTSTADAAIRLIEQGRVDRLELARRARNTPVRHDEPEQEPNVDTTEIKGVWLTKRHSHLGGDIEVLVELPDGTHRAAITGYTCDDGPISHYVRSLGITSAPVKEFEDIDD